MADKQTALVGAIATGVQNILAADLRTLGEGIAMLKVMIASILARLETLEAAANSGGTATKRAVRTGAAAKAGAKKPAGTLSKNMNAKLYFRYLMQEDLEGVRDIYGTEANLVEAEKNDSAVAKRDRKKDEAGYFSAVGAYIWGHILTKEQQEEFRAKGKAFKEMADRNAAAPQLEEDANPQPEEDAADE